MPFVRDPPQIADFAAEAGESRIGMKLRPDDAGTMEHRGRGPGSLLYMRPLARILNEVPWIDARIWPVRKLAGLGMGMVLKS